MARKFICRCCEFRESIPNAKGMCTKHDKPVKSHHQGCQYYEDKNPKSIKIK